MSVEQYHITREDKERFEWLASWQTIRDPFTHEMMMILDKRANTQVKTCGIEVKALQLILHYNPTWFRGISNAEANFVFQHEMIHVAFHHCTYRRPSNPAMLHLWNIAADLATNALIPLSSEVQAPKDVLFPAKFGLEDKLSCEVYADILRDMLPPQKEKQEGDGGDEGDEEEGQGQGQGGQEGDEDEEEKGKGKSNQKGRPSDLPSQDTMDSHDMWNESEVVDEMIRDRVDQIAKSNQWGSMSGELKEKILAAQAHQVDWRSILRFHLGNLPHWRKSPTIKRPNRRFGYPYCGTQKDSVDAVLVAFDTSGSISNENLSQFMTEVNRLAEDYPVFSVEFDCGPTVEPTKWRKSQVYEFSGRGGTDVRPVFEMAQEKGYKSLVVLTDGYFEHPEQPLGMDVIWVITDGGVRPVEWGAYVQLHEKDSWKRKK